MTDYKEKMIRVLRELSTDAPATERAIYRRFSQSKRGLKDAQRALAELLSQGYVNRLGTGRRDSPFRIVLSSTWEHNKCPLCGHVVRPC